MQYRPELDGLRAVAVIPVVLFHAKFSAFQGGFLGVDIFFVISGYLITSSILSEHDEFRILGFYERRARRILPALLAVLLVSLLAACWLLPPEPLLDFSKSLIASLFFVANIYFWRRNDYFAEPADLLPLLHTWSLSVEEQFYLFFPLLLIAARSRINATLAVIVGLGLASLLWAWTKHTSAPSDVFYFAQFRAWQLLAGATIAWIEFHKGRKQHWAGVTIGVILVIVSFAITGPNTAAIVGSILATSGTAFVIYYGGNNLPSLLLCIPPFRWIGLISYSLYLWHQPLFVFARFYSIKALIPLQYGGLIIASILISCLSYLYIERPARRHMTRSHFTMSVAIVSSFSSVVAIAAIAGGGFPSRYSEETLAILKANPARGVAVRDGRPCRRSIDDACIIGDASQISTFAILGDSHAEALTNALSEKLDARRLSAIVLTKPACPLLFDGVEIGASQTCSTHSQEVFAEVKRRGVRNVIINERSAAYFLGAFDNGEGGIENERITMFATKKTHQTEAERLENLYTSQANFVRALLDEGLTVYYIFPVPEAGWHVPRTLVKAIATGNLPLTTSKVKYRERNGGTLELAKIFSANAQFVPIFPSDHLCNHDRCKTHIGAQILYTDTDHLSESGAEIIADAVSQRLR